MNYQALWNELINDPATVGYIDPANSSNDIENARLLNEESQTVPRTEITSAELWENTDLSEYKSLTAGERQAYDVLVNLETIDVSEGTNSRTTLAALFPQGSNTRANLVALVQESVPTSRAEQIDWPRVYAHHIETARERYG